MWYHSCNMWYHSISCMFIQDSKSQYVSPFWCEIRLSTHCGRGGYNGCARFLLRGTTVTLSKCLMWSWKVPYRSCKSLYWRPCEVSLGPNSLAVKKTSSECENDPIFTPLSRVYQGSRIRYLFTPNFLLDTRLACIKYLVSNLTLTVGPIGGALWCARVRNKKRAHPLCPPLPKQKMNG